MPQILCSVLGPSLQGRYGGPESCSKKDDEVVKGLKHWNYEKWLRELRLFSLGKRRLRGNIIALYNHLIGGYSEVGVGLLFPGDSDRMRERNEKQNFKGNLHNSSFPPLLSRNTLSTTKSPDGP